MMNNFLEHLVARSWNQVETVQPRPVSLFEPIPRPDKTAVPPATPWNTMDKTEFGDIVREDEIILPQPLATRSALKPGPAVRQQLDTEPVIDTTLPKQTAVPASDLQPVISQPIARPKPQPMAANSASMERLPTLSHPTVPLLQTELPTSSAPLSSLATRLPEVKQPEKLTETRQEIVRERIIERPVMTHKPDRMSMKIEPLLPTSQPFETRQETVRERIIERPAGSDKSEIVPIKTDWLSPLAQPLPSVTAVRPPLTDEPVATHQPEPPSEKQITTIQPQIRPFVPLQKRVPSEPAQPEASPTIHVTIGRIEVRATPAPTTPTRKEQGPRSPVMGLDEYLRQRNGGQT